MSCQAHRGKGQLGLAVFLEFLIGAAVEQADHEALQVARPSDVRDHTVSADSVLAKLRRAAITGARSGACFKPTEPSARVEKP